MKFILIKNSRKENLSVPAAALQIAGMESEERLEAHVADDAIAVIKKEMTALEMITVIEFLDKLSTELEVRLAAACGICQDCGLCDNNKENTFCVDGRCLKSELQISSDVMEQAGFFPDDFFSLEVSGESICINPLTDGDESEEEDILDTVPMEFVEGFRKSGICLNGLRDLLEEGNVVYGK